MTGPRHAGRGLGRRLLVSGALIVAGLTPGLAAGQEVNLVRVTDVSGYVEVGADLEREERISGGAVKWSQAEGLEVIETVGLTLEGDVYHPLFLRFSGDAEIEFSQGRDEPTLGSGALQGDRGRWGGLWRLRFFETHPVSGQIFGSNRVYELKRDFAEDQLVETGSFGGSLRIGQEPLSVTFDYDHEARRGEQAMSYLDEVSDSWTIRGAYRGDSFEDRFDYERIDEELQGRRNDSHALNASHSMHWDPEAPRQWSTYFSVRDRVLETRRRTIHGRSVLIVEHAQTLSSSHHLSFNRTDIDDAYVDRWDAQTGLRHQLYGSLTSSARLRLEAETGSFGMTRRYSAFINESYRKRLGSWGVLHVGVAPALELKRQNPRLETSLALDERISLSGRIFTRLSRRQIDSASIVVTDRDGVPFDEGRDYTLRLEGPAGAAQVEIRRSDDPDGRIPDLDVVLVTYRHRNGGPGESLVSTFDLSTRLTLWRTFELEAGYRTRRDRRLSGRGDSLEEPRRQRFAGLTFRSNRVVASLEYQDEGAGFGPDSQLSQRLSITAPQWAGWAARAGGSHSYVQRLDSEEEVSRLRVFASIRRRFGRMAELELEGEHERESWRGTDARNRGLLDLNGFEIAATLKLWVRAVEIETGVEIERVERRGHRENSERVFLRIRRAF